MSDLMYALQARITAALLQLRDDEKGQGMVEYGLILVLIALAAVVTLTTLGTTIAGQFTKVTGYL